MPKFITIEDAERIKQLEKEIKNKFKFDWLQCTVSAQILGKEEVINCYVGETIKKIDLPGMAICDLCNVTITYAAKCKSYHN